MLPFEVKEDRYFRTSSLTHSKQAITGRDDSDPTLWPCCTRGGTLTSPPPLLLASPEAEGGRIMVTGTGSPTREAVKGYALLWRREVPPPTQCETVNLFEEEDSQSETPWRVSSNEEPPIGMTSRSTRGCWIEPSESLPSITMAES